MAEQQFTMTSSQIAEILGTVGSPLIVVSELIKNAVDISAQNVDIYYNRNEKVIMVENDHKGFTPEEIEDLAYPGVSAKKQAENLTNERGMFLTGSKGLGLLSVFLLCDYAEISTAPKDKKVYKVILNKQKGTVEHFVTECNSEIEFTRISLKNVDEEIIDFLSSEQEVRKLRHICTYLYKNGQVPFPTMRLHISGQTAQEITFSCAFPPMLYDTYFVYSKENHTIRFRCLSPDKSIYEDEVVFDAFKLKDLQAVMLDKYGIKDTIPTRTNDFSFSDFDGVPTFEGRILVYEKNLAGAQLKAYGAGVNIYVNDFALYNYLSEENDWLGLADYSQRKKVTRLKPHNVFGYVNFPLFNENGERLKISNERADFIQDLIYSKLMYLLKGVIMFAVFNIDIADKNPKYKSNPTQENRNLQDESSSEQAEDDSGDSTQIPNRNGNINGDGTGKDDADFPHNEKQGEGNQDCPYSAYSPENLYKPKKIVLKRLQFTMDEGAIIDTLRDTDDLSNKIYNLAFELSRLDLQVYRNSIAYLYRALLESSSKYFSSKHPKVAFDGNRLESSIVNVLNCFGNLCGKGKPLSDKAVQMWRDTVTKRKLINALNQYVHNEQPVDALLLQETWGTMKSYIIACLTIN